MKEAENSGFIGGLTSKNILAKNLILMARDEIKKNKKVPLIWLELNGCSGNIISLLNTNDPGVNYFLKELVELRYDNSLMVQEGERAYEQFLKTLEEEFILVVEGAVSLRDQGLYNVIANYKGNYITGSDALLKAGNKAKYILAVGTCASYGGPSAAAPNLAGCISVRNFLNNQEVIQVPGCPGHPDWIVGTIAYIILYGKPEVDEDNRPTVFYGETIHNRCPRRFYFDQKIFARKLGESECMFRLGCRGPVTRTDCPIRRWNDTDNWPIGNNTPCIGCANFAFPGGMEPFVRY